MNQSLSDSCNIHVTLKKLCMESCVLMHMYLAFNVFSSYYVFLLLLFVFLYASVSPFFACLTCANHCLHFRVC